MSYFSYQKDVPSYPAGHRLEQLPPEPVNIRTEPTITNQAETTETSSSGSGGHVETPAKDMVDSGPVGVEPDSTLQGHDEATSSETQKDPIETSTESRPQSGNPWSTDWEKPSTKQDLPTTTDLLTPQISSTEEHTQLNTTRLTDTFVFENEDERRGRAVLRDDREDKYESYNKVKEGRPGRSEYDGSVSPVKHHEVPRSQRPTRIPRRSASAGRGAVSGDGQSDEEVNTPGRRTGQSYSSSDDLTPPHTTTTTTTSTATNTTTPTTHQLSSDKPGRKKLIRDSTRTFVVDPVLAQTAARRRPPQLRTKTFSSTSVAPSLDSGCTYTVSGSRTNLIDDCSDTTERQDDGMRSLAVAMSLDKDGGARPQYNAMMREVFKAYVQENITQRQCRFYMKNTKK